jgi:acetylornithine deacetylase/succinyl-diaminopimelate desuccinylase-like protein
MTTDKDLSHLINQEECLDFLSRLIQIKSYSSAPGENEATQYMADAMKSIGLDADVYPFGEESRQNARGVAGLCRGGWLCLSRSRERRQESAI